MYVEECKKKEVGESRCLDHARLHQGGRKLEGDLRRFPIDSESRGRRGITHEGVGRQDVLDSLAGTLAQLCQVGPRAERSDGAR